MQHAIINIITERPIYDRPTKATRAFRGDCVKYMNELLRMQTKHVWQIRLFEGLF